jgi:hypothetical protein
METRFVENGLFSGIHLPEILSDCCYTKAAQPLSEIVRASEDFDLKVGAIRHVGSEPDTDSTAYRRSRERERITT